jgi:hypothetical protein
MNLRAVIKGVNRRKICVIGFVSFPDIFRTCVLINLKATKMTLYKFINSAIRYYKNVNE